MNAHPNSNGGDDSLPEVLQAVWPRHQVLDFFADLRAGANVDHVQVRSRNADGIEDRKTTLREAEALFTAGDAQAIQVKYRFDGEAWCDTVLPQADGAKVIRSRQL